MYTLLKHLIAALNLSLISLFFASSLWAGSLTPIIELDHPKVLAGQKTVLYTLIRFDVAEIKEDSTKTRPQLNLSIVIDRSGSMSDKGKLDHAVASAKFLVDYMQPTDMLSVVEYDDRITVLWPASPLESPEMIKKRINTLTPRGSTNLTGGMMKGADEVLRNTEDKKINRVILLSDGLANVGITNPTEIKQLAKVTKNKGVQISTMGLGLSFNEDLMQAIAEHANGNYYFIESPSQMRRIFQQEMDTLFTTVAKDVLIKFSPSDMVQKIDAFGYMADNKQRDTYVELGNFYSGETRSLLLRLEIMPTLEESIKLGDVQLSYFDVGTQSTKNDVHPLRVTTTKKPEEVKTSANKEIVIQSILMETEDKHEKSVRLYEKGDIKQALQNIRDLTTELADKNTDLADLKLAKKLEALKMEAKEIEEAEANSQQKASYLKKSKQRFYSSKKGKSGQYMLQEGMSGYEVETLQRALSDTGHYKGKIDGLFSTDLSNSLKSFQKKEGLTVDGIAGPATLKALGIY